jgi:hypothetical protein
MSLPSYRIVCMNVVISMTCVVNTDVIRLIHMHTLTVTRYMHECSHINNLDIYIYIHILRDSFNKVLSAHRSEYPHHHALWACMIAWVCGGLFWDAFTIPAMVNDRGYSESSRKGSECMMY